MNKLDLDTKIEEIKELVTTPDYDMIDKGVTLARELNEPAVFETLLEGCRIHIDKEKDYNFPLIPGELFRGDDNNQHYLNYALLNLIGYAPGSWCGNSYHIVTLPANKAWVFIAPIYTGMIKAKLRFVLGKITSNEFMGSINKEQFTIKQGHIPTSIMDPYDE